MKLVYKALFLSSILLASCGGGGDDSPPPPTPPEMVADPKATTLVFPEDNTECNEGVILNETRSTVTFRWNASDDTDRYEVNARNLSTNQNIAVNTQTPQADLTIDRGAPYEWFVISKATGTTATATSSTFKFYNQGPGIENYAPFPAEVVNPARGSDLMNTSGTVMLEWSGSDIDNDITGYEILLDTAADPMQSIGTTAETSFEATVNAGEIYYWRIISTDSAKNTSESEIFEFRVSS